MTLKELETFRNIDGKFFSQFYRHGENLPHNEYGVKVGLIRYHFTYWLVYWQQQRLLNTLYRIDLLPFLDMSVNDIISTIADTLKQTHTSDKKRLIIDKVVNEVQKEMREI